MDATKHCSDKLKQKIAGNSMARLQEIDRCVDGPIRAVSYSYFPTNRPEKVRRGDESGRS